MNRLEKKCAVASAGLHLLLAGILLTNSAFVAPRQKVETPSVLQLVETPDEKPLASLSGPLSTASPNATLRTVVKPSNAPNAPPLHTDYSPGPRIIVNTNLVTRRTTRTTATGIESTAEKSNANLVNAFGEAIKGIRSGISGGTTINLNFGSGTGGDTYAAYVRDAYKQAWDTTTISATYENPVTQVSVSIGSDGKVMAARIIKRSGDAAMDESVQRTLDRVTFIRPFADGAKETPRTYTINFDLTMLH